MSGYCKRLKYPVESLVGDCDGAGCDPNLPDIIPSIGEQPCPLMRRLVSGVAEADAAGLIPKEWEDPLWDRE